MIAADKARGRAVPLSQRVDCDVMLITGVSSTSSRPILVLAALGVITARNPVYAALFLVLRFVTAPAIWLLIEAEFLAIVLVLVYVGAVMVLFLFVVMMLDINVEPSCAQGFTRFAWLGWLTALVVIVEIAGVVWARGGLGLRCEPRRHAAAGDLQQHRRARRRALHQVRLSVRARGRAAAGGDRRGHRAHHAPPRGPARYQDISEAGARCGARTACGIVEDGAEHGEAAA